MDFYDLNFVPAFSSPILLRTQFEDSQCEARTNHFCPNHGVHLSRRISPVRSEIRRQSKCAPTVVLEPVSGDGLCSTDLSPQPSRHRSLFESTAFQALSLRLQSPHPTLHSGRRQRASRLENLRRLCPYSDRHRSASVRRHRSWIGSGGYRLRSGRYHHRSVSECFPLGHLQASQGSHQASHADGSSQLYPIPLRRVSYYSEQTDQFLVFLTNNFSIDPLTVAALYRYRWQIELFFKWIKQHLRIKRFFGTSPNSVKSQIWIAVAVYVLIAIIKKKLGLQQNLYTILQVLSLTLFENTS